MTQIQSYNHIVRNDVIVAKNLRTHFSCSMTSGESNTPDEDLRASSAPDNGSPLDPSN